VSAQDDVLAAFGEPSRMAHVEEEVETAEAAEALEPAAANEDGSATEERAEAGEPAEASEVAAPADQESEASEVEAADQESEEGNVEAGAGKQPEAEATETTTGDEPQASEVKATADATPPATAPTPAPPAQPYLDPAAFFAQLQAEAAPKPKRRWPRLVLRYVSALVVVGAVGAGTAYAITLPRRTDVPFLATPSDGRYAFPFLAKPQPPAGEPAPGDDGNKGQVHYGDLHQYLLPTPTGAVRNEDGWESIADFESSLSGSDVSNHLYDAGLRRVARRGWTAADGQHTVIELLQFPDHDAAYDVDNLLDTANVAKAGSPENVVPQVTIRGFEDETYNLPVHKLDQVNGLPGHMERRVVFQSGDVVAIVTTTAPTGTPDTPTEQVVMLQAEMLR
jgi:hypothetical protein